MAAMASAASSRSSPHLHLEMGMAHPSTEITTALDGDHYRTDIEVARRDLAAAEADRVRAAQHLKELTPAPRRPRNRQSIERCPAGHCTLRASVVSQPSSSWTEPTLGPLPSTTRRAHPGALRHRIEGVEAALRRPGRGRRIVGLAQPIAWKRE